MNTKNIFTFSEKSEYFSHKMILGFFSHISYQGSVLSTNKISAVKYPLKGQSMPNPNPKPNKSENMIIFGK